jgi:hypothetical protein
MKYMMMMNTPNGPAGEYKNNDWAPEDFKAHIRFMMQLNKGLKESGEFVEAQGLTPPSQAKLVRAGTNGEPITDGPFPESKEFLAGFWILDVASPERAYELAAKVSTAPGPGGKPLNMGIELRQVLDGPPPEV